MVDNNQHADRFAEMAERIRHNSATQFGGAFVIISPDGEAMDALVLDSSGDAAQFLMLLQARITNHLKILEEKERLNPYSRR